jgi:hypothetical protein
VSWGRRDREAQAPGRRRGGERSAKGDGPARRSAGAEISHGVCPLSSWGARIALRVTYRASVLLRRTTRKALGRWGASRPLDARQSLCTKDARAVTRCPPRARSGVTKREGSYKTPERLRNTLGFLHHRPQREPFDISERLRGAKV